MQADARLPLVSPAIAILRTIGFEVPLSGSAVNGAIRGAVYELVCRYDRPPDRFTDRQKSELLRSLITRFATMSRRTECKRALRASDAELVETIDTELSDALDGCLTQPERWNLPADLPGDPDLILNRIGAKLFPVAVLDAHKGLIST